MTRGRGCVTLSPLVVGTYVAQCETLLSCVGYWKPNGKGPTEKKK
jgi:hypothetical protein